MKKKAKPLSLREKDPFLAREQQRYEFPLPSREWIIEILENEGVPLSMPALAEKLTQFRETQKQAVLTMELPAVG